MDTTGCLAKNYLPLPSREWYRYSTPCMDAMNLLDPNAKVYIPSLKISVPVTELVYIQQMIKKGNILQYRGQYGATTKKEKFSKIAKGLWNNRKTFWYLFQEYKDGGDVIPSGLPDSNNDEIPPDYPPPPDDNAPFPSDNNTFSFPIVNPLVRPSEPVLVRSFVQQCSPRELSNIVCIPTSSSNVPGPIVNLCYPKYTTVNIPRPHFGYGNVSSKWPINSKRLNIPAINSNVKLSTQTKLLINTNGYFP
jgi:hypothetical protein